MVENKLFEAFRELRAQTLSLAESVSSDIVDIVPVGFNNSIRWNLGHILVAWDHGIFPKINENRKIPLQYHRMFPNGSRPSAWETEPPAFEEIVDKLKLQVDEIIAASEGKLDDLIAKPFLQIKDLRGMFEFHLTEEQHHLDCMLKIKAAIDATGVSV